MTGDWEYNKELVEAMEWHGFQSQIPHWVKLSIVGPLQLAAIFTLSFNLIARNIFAVLSLIAITISLFDGVAAYSELEMFIVQLYYLSTGVALALSFSVLRDRFHSIENKKIEY